MFQPNCLHLCFAGVRGRRSEGGLRGVVVSGNRSGAGDHLRGQGILIASLDDVREASRAANPVTSGLSCDMSDSYRKNFVGSSRDLDTTCWPSLPVGPQVTQMLPIGQLMSVVHLGSMELETRVVMLHSAALRAISCGDLLVLKWMFFHWLPYFWLLGCCSRSSGIRRSRSSWRGGTIRFLSGSQPSSPRSVTGMCFSAPWLLWRSSSPTSLVLSSTMRS